MAKSSLIKSNVKAGHTFQLKKGRKYGAKEDLSFNITQKRELPEDKQDPPMGLIQGRIPDSILEWRTYLGAVKLKIKFVYQYPVRGGKSRRGGIVADFLFLIPPLPKLVFCQGKFWHEVFKNPLVERTLIDRIMSENRGQYGLPLFIKEKDVQSADDAYWLLSKELIHG